MEPIQPPAQTPLHEHVEGEYLLEMPVKCPGCKAEIDSVQVIRLLRSRVNFTSTLPRRGYVAVCPECTWVLPVTLKWGVV